MYFIFLTESNELREIYQIYVLSLVTLNCKSYFKFMILILKPHVFMNKVLIKTTFESQDGIQIRTN